MVVGRRSSIQNQMFGCDKFDCTMHRYKIETFTWNIMIHLNLYFSMLILMYKKTMMMTDENIHAFVKNDKFDIQRSFKPIKRMNKNKQAYAFLFDVFGGLDST